MMQVMLANAPIAMTVLTAGSVASLNLIQIGGVLGGGGVGGGGVDGSGGGVDGGGRRPASASCGLASGIGRR